MSFGFSASDVVLLVQLAWTTVENSRKACGEYAELTRETTSLHINLQRLDRETAKPESPINRPGDTCRQDLAPIVDGCGKALHVLDRILEKYNALSDEERSRRKLWKAVRFGNGKLANVKDLRLKLIHYTSNLALFLNMVSVGSMGIVEKQMYEAGGDLKDIRRAVNGITAHLMSGANKEGSILTDYADDDKAVWRAFRRELVKGGFSSDVIREHKDTIQAYVKELGSRGILDDEDLKDSGNVSEEIEDTETAQATPQSRDEAMGSSESESSAARVAVSAGNWDPRENGAFPQQTQIAPAPLTMNSVSDTLPSTTQADAETNSVVEGDSREVDKVDDRTNRCLSLSPSSLAQSPTELAEEDTWFESQSNCGLIFRSYELPYESCILGPDPKHAKDFECLSNQLLVRSETLEFQAEAKGFLKVAQIILCVRMPGSVSEIRSSAYERKPLLKVSPLLCDLPCWLRRFKILPSVILRWRPSGVMDFFLRESLRHIDARPEKWRITKWPLPREKTEREGHEDGNKGKRSIVSPHAAPALVEDMQDPPSTTEDIEMVHYGDEDTWRIMGNERGKMARSRIGRRLELRPLDLQSALPLLQRQQSFGHNSPNDYSIG